MLLLMNMLSVQRFVEAAEISIKYSGYIERERLLADKLSRLEDLIIAGKFDYNELSNLSIEARQKLSKIQPRTIWAGFSNQRSISSRHQCAFDFDGSLINCFT